MRLVSLPFVLAALLPVVQIGCRCSSDERSQTIPADAGKPPVRTIKSTQLTAPRIVKHYAPPVELPLDQGLTLESPGKAPRVLYRYAPERGTRNLTIAAAIKTKDPAANDKRMLDLPEVRYGFSMSLLDRAEQGQEPPADRTKDAQGKSAGDFAFQVLALPATIADPAAGEAGEMARLRQLAEEVVARYRQHVQGRRATVAVGKHGRVSAVALTPESAAAEDADTTRHEMYQLLLESVVPFPDQAIGVGARWKAKMALRRGAAVVTQTAEYELLEAKGSRLRVGATLTQIGESQMLDVPGLPAGVMVELIALFWQGRGEYVVELGSITPAQATLAVELRVHTSLLQGQSRNDEYVGSTGTVTLTTATPSAATP